MIMDIIKVNISDLILPTGSVTFSSIFSDIKTIDVNNIPPIVIDKDNLIIDGKKRYLAFIYHELDFIPVVIRTENFKIRF
jgi:hypothetical protein